jgi:hypothetical protein
VFEQLALFGTEDEHERRRTMRRDIHKVQRYLTARFGANCLRRAALLQPGAPLPEWRIGWIEDEGELPDREYA